MKLNQWTIALAGAGVVSLGAVVQAEEAQHQVLTALSSTTLSGYVDTSAIWKFGTGNANMPGRSYDGADKQDGFNLDVVKLSLEKPLDEANWAAGYRVDILAGPDAGNFGSFASSGTHGGSFGTAAAIEQAYVNLRAPLGNGLDFKVGVFDSVIGYESFDSYKNPNFSRSYGYYIDPKQHTGVLASYQLADWISVAAGVANTDYGPINARPIRAAGVPASESEKTYMGLISLTAPDSMGALKGATLYGGIINGLSASTAFGTITPTDITSYYVGGTIPTPIQGLAIGASYDYRGNTTQSGIPSTYANATALYISYQATEKLKLANRLEYASGDGAFGFPFGFPGTWGTGRAGEEEFFGETFTVDYSLWANVVTRAEFRWDHDLKGGDGVFGNPAVGRTGFRDKNALSLALNVIYKF